MLGKPLRHFAPMSLLTLFVAVTFLILPLPCPPTRHAFASDYAIEVETILLKGRQYRPKIHGNHIVYLQKGVGVQERGYIYDLVTGTAKKIAAPSGGGQNSNDTVFVRLYGREGYYYISLPRMISPPDLTITGQVRVCEHSVIWFSEAGNLCLYDMSTKESLEIEAISKSRGIIGDPSVSGDRVIWVDESNGNRDIYLYDLSEKKETPICVLPSSQEHIDVFEDIVVWEDSRNGNADIYMYDLSSKRETRITTDMADQLYPEIYGKRIVWQDERHYGYPYQDIYMYDIETGRSTRITDTKAGRWEPDIFQDRIVWQEGVTDNGEDEPYIAVATIRQVAAREEETAGLALDKFVLKQDELPKGYIFTDSRPEHELSDGEILTPSWHRGRVRDCYAVSYRRADGAVGRGLWLGSVTQSLTEFDSEEALQDCLPIVLYDLLFSTRQGCIIYPPKFQTCLMSEGRFLALTTVSSEESLPLYNRITEELRGRGFEGVPLFDEYVAVCSDSVVGPVGDEEASRKAEAFKKVNQEFKTKLEARVSASYFKLVSELERELGEDFTNLTRSWKLKEKDPVWSPDGKHIAFTGDYVRHWHEEYAPSMVTCVMKADGTEQREVAANNLRRPMWSKDGKGLYLEGRGCAQAYDVDLAETTSVNAEDYPEPSRTSSREADISPDGENKATYNSDRNELVVEHGDEIVRVPKEDVLISEFEQRLRDRASKQHPVTEIDRDKVRFDDRVYSCVWSPDSKHLAFALYIFGGSGVRYLSYSLGWFNCLCLYSFPERSLKKVYDGDHVQSIDWIDNETLVFLTDKALIRMNIKNKQTAELVTDGVDAGASFVLSPDGLRIAYAGWAESGDRGAWIIDSDGRNKTAVSDTHAESIGGLVWSTDGRKLRFGLSGTTQYYDLAGGQFRDLSNSEYDELPDPHVSPNGEMKLYFASRRKGEATSTSIGVFHPDNRKKEILVPQSKGIEVGSPAWHPGSEWIAYTHRESGKPAYIHVVSSKTRVDIRLTEGAHPTWHPDGKSIAFWRVTPLSTDVFSLKWEPRDDASVRSRDSTEAVPEIIEASKDEEETVRRSAVSALYRIGPDAKEAVPELIDALKDKDGTVRRYAVSALYRIGPDAREAVPELIDALKDKDGTVRRAAASALASIGPDAVPELIKALKDEDKMVRTEAAGALIHVRPRAIDAIPALIEALKDENWTVRRYAAGALGGIGRDAEEVVPALIEASEDDDRKVRGFAALALGIIGPHAKDAVPALIKALRDDDGRVRTTATDALGRIGQGAVPALIEALKDDDETVRKNAAIALGRVRPDAKEAVPELADALKDENKTVRRSAAGALRRINPAEVPAGIEALEDYDNTVRKNAATALGRVRPGARDAVPALIEALMGGDREVRKNAVFALGRIGPGAVPALTEALKDEDETVRGFAAEALCRIGPGAVPALTEALKDENETVRGFAAEALGKTGPDAKDAVPALIEALKDEDGKVRMNAALALGNIGPDAKDALPTLIDTLKDEYTLARDYAAHGLGRIGPDAKDAVPALIEALRDEDWNVPPCVHQVLGGVRPGGVPVLITGWNVHESFATALCRIGPVAVPGLIKASKDDDGRGRSTVLFALALMGPDAREAVPALIDALMDWDPEVCYSAISALGRIGPDAKEAVPELIEALKNKERTIRRAAADALGSIGPDAKQAVPELIKALKDEDETVRKNAAYALDRIGPMAYERTER